ncbi:MAG: hypothetical protein ACREUU_06475, partial [Gammaproteobacteria bacterium]
GYIVLGDGERAINLISAGLDLDNLMLSITEPQTQAATNRNIPGPLAATYYFRLSFKAADRTLTLRYGTNTTDPYPGPQVLVKDSAASPWRQDVAIGTNYLRTECLRSFTFTTDKHTNALNPPVNLLLAGTTTLSNAYPITVNVWIRNDTTCVWTATSPGSVEFDPGPGLNLAAARFLFDHVDRVTGVHHLFCAFGSQARIVRGAYNAATGLIDWDAAPELTASERVVSGGELNGFLYVGIASDGNPNNLDGGLFWREDGTNAQWHFVYEWPKNYDLEFQDVRGFTALPHPKGFGYDIGLVGLSGLGIISRIDPIGGDPRNGHRITQELDMRQFLGDEWRDGVPIEFEANVAYNDMPELMDPATGKPVRIMGMDVHHPDEYDTPEGNCAWYLIRHLDATYELGRVIDPTNTPPGPFLRSCRAERASPFPEEAGRVVYLGGFDAATNYPP